ncbi:stage III sporulation protein AG [Proteiniborus sp. MB09-C3]|uniref:stage III sporulation protein AG n=1 Tax=Proteiniborus sp. MB09-C3 TaxID=3050072 RepID=UPI00255712F7|nr:stage III sporulation protein AG [Proteiniborus sp. MB09-C3]WIV10998.1 stage III sporulation protein AG [Proteiniborus sp. MB09-C3]
MIEKLKEFFNPKNQKKNASNLVVLLFAGAIVLLLSNYFLGKKNDTGKSTLNGNDNGLREGYVFNSTEESYADNIEKKLEEILKKIKGVGEVYVMITFDDTSEKVPVFNTTQTVEKTDEKDAQGGTREVTREDLSQQVVVGSGGDSLMIMKETKPKVRGVIVVAEGAEDIEIKEKLYSAVKTVLGISGNKVEIYSSK